MVSRDKKVAHGMMHFAVLIDEGDLVMVPKAMDSELQLLLDEYLEHDYVFRRN
jgi:hypothetical protein